MLWQAVVSPARSLQSSTYCLIILRSIWLCLQFVPVWWKESPFFSCSCPAAKQSCWLFLLKCWKEYSSANLFRCPLHILRTIEASYLWSLRKLIVSRNLYFFQLTWFQFCTNHVPFTLSNLSIFGFPSISSLSLFSNPHILASIEWCPLRIPTNFGNPFPATLIYLKSFL